MMNSAKKVTKSEYRKKHYQLHRAEELTKGKIWRQKNREHKLEKLREWQKNNIDYRRCYAQARYIIQRKELIQKSQKYMIQHPEIRVANNAARQIITQNTCEFCGASRNIVKHHFDYHYPLSVVFTCQSCHKWIHKDAPIEVLAQ